MCAEFRNGGGWGLLETRDGACKIVGAVRDTTVILSRDRVARDAPGALY